MTRTKVALVGCGHISRTHLASWARVATATVAGVFDLDRELAERRAREFGVGRVFESLEEAIELCEAIDVCTPPQSHYAIAKQVLEAGRHLLIEKPLVTRSAEWHDLERILDERGGSVTVVHNLKFAASTLKARRWIDEGRIGEPLRLRRDFLTDPQSDRMLVAERHWSHSLPGGRWFETLPHELYLTHLFLGPLSLRSVWSSPLESSRFSFPEEVTVVLAEGDRSATFSYSSKHSGNRRALTIFGSEGRIEIDILGDFAELVRTRDRKWARAISRRSLESASTLRQATFDRLRYLGDRFRGLSAHARLIEADAAYLAGTSSPPTPREEVNYSVEKCEEIGRAIDVQSGHSSKEEGAGS